MPRRTFLLAATVLFACNDPSPSDDDGAGSGSGGAAESTDTSSSGSGADGASTGQADASSSGENEEDALCPPLTSPMFSRWEMLADPDHLTGIMSMLSLDDGSVVVADPRRIVRYDADGVPTAVYSTQAPVRGLAPAVGEGDFVALLHDSDDDTLSLAAYGLDGEMGGASISFAGVVGYDMPIVHDEATTVLTLERTADETSGTLRFRDATLSAVAEVDVAWTLDLWAEHQGDRIFVAALAPDDMVVTAYDGAAEVWSTDFATIGEDAWRSPSGLLFSDGLIVHSGSSPTPLRALDPNDGSEQWTSEINPAAMTTSPCGDVYALVAGESEDSLYRIGDTGPELVSALSRATMPHAGDATIQGLVVGPGGAVVVARVLDDIGIGGPYVNLKAY